MPHQCTECGHTFEDGSKEMLSGCPECGGNTFQFLPNGVEPEDDSDPDPPTDRSHTDDSARSHTDSDQPPAREPNHIEKPTPTGDASEREDSAQANARSSMVEADELPQTASESEPAPGPEETPDLSQLREELNDQFESIRIVDHGQYELNLMELYKREEFIIALQENGRYVIEVPESFRRGPDS